jgi:hypothetical protein
MKVSEFLEQIRDPEYDFGEVEVPLYPTHPETKHKIQKHIKPKPKPKNNNQQSRTQTPRIPMQPPRTTMQPP